METVSLNALAREVHDIAKEKGWYDRARPFPELIALAHSELSEALESWRKYEPSLVYHADSPTKPDGWGVELIDALIRILDMCAEFSVDTDKLFWEKMAYNRVREYRHGDKRI